MLSAAGVNHLQTVWRVCFAIGRFLYLSCCSLNENRICTGIILPLGASRPCISYTYLEICSRGVCCETKDDEYNSVPQRLVFCMNELYQPHYIFLGAIKSELQGILVGCKC